MQIVSVIGDAFLVGREDIPRDQAIELSIAQVVGQVQDDPLFVEFLDRLPENTPQLSIIQRLRIRKFQFGLKPLTDREGWSTLPS